MSAPAPLRLRCPKDSPRDADLHLAIDVRLPCDVRILARWTSGPSVASGRPQGAVPAPRGGVL